VFVVLPEDGPLRDETCRSDTVNNVVLIVTVCSSGIVQGHYQDKGSWLGLLF